jgi:hypothetical protein
MKARFHALGEGFTITIAILGSLLAISLLVVPLFDPGRHADPQELLAETKALWHMDEAEGDVVADANGTYNAEAYDTQVVAGPFGKARYFNGLSSYIKTPLSFQGAKAVTISIWLRTEPPSQWAEPGESGDLHIILDTGHDARNNFVVQSEGATYDIFSLYCAGPAVFEMPRGVWSHIVFVIIPQERKRQVYLDGLKSSELISSEVPNFGSIPLVFGKWATEDARYFKGSMCEAAVWGRALSEHEIEALSDFYRTQVRKKEVAYPPPSTPASASNPASTPAPAPSPLLPQFPSGVKALWHMDEAEGDVIADANGTYNATAYDAQVVTGPFGEARYFNGSNSYIKTSLSFQEAKAVTISLWLKPEPTQSGNVAIVLDAGHDRMTSFVVQTTAITATFVWHSADTDLLFKLNKEGWTFLVVTADVTNGKLEVYQDGSLIEQKVTKYVLQLSSTPLTFGKWATEDARYFKGSMCEAAVWDRVLSAEEIKALFAFYQKGR